MIARLGRRMQAWADATIERHLQKLLLQMLSGLATSTDSEFYKEAMKPSPDPFASRQDPHAVRNAARDHQAAAHPVEDAARGWGVRRIGWLMRLLFGPKRTRDLRGVAQDWVDARPA